MHETLQLDARAFDAAGQVLTGRTVMWRSLDEAILRISPDGLVTPTSLGQTMVEAKVDGRVTTATFTVLPARVARLQLEVSKTVLEPGESVLARVRAFDVSGAEISLDGRTVKWTRAGIAISLSQAASLEQVDGSPVILLRAFDTGDARVVAVVDGISGRSDLIAVKTPPLQQIAVGENFACGLTSAGFVYCWGTEDTDERVLSRDVPNTRPGVPWKVGGDGAGLQLTQLSAGRQHVCGVAAGQAVCWGRGEQGQIGDGRFRNAGPTLVAGGAFTQVVTGGDRSCGLTGLGAILCWGDNTSGYLYVADGAQRVGRPSALKSTQSMLSITLGARHGCGVGTNGYAYCWGDHRLSARLSLSAAYFRSLELPVYSVLALDAGASSTCALTETNAALCWGENSSGQLGNGSVANRGAPTPVPGVTFVTIRTGGTHTCGISMTGIAYCWGANDEGQLGVGGTAPRYVPTPVATVARFAEIAVDGKSTCGRTIEGTVLCWGAIAGTRTPLAVS
jgi:alpha-tubulin suppressor-like RCC1 family protein